jgi:hypothetical protein
MSTSTINSIEFSPGKEDARQAIAEAKEQLNQWLALHANCQIINIETIYGRYGTHRAHYDGESLGVAGIRVWYHQTAA